MGLYDDEFCSHALDLPLPPEPAQDGPATTTVALLLNARGKVCSVHADAEDARGVAARYNADPFVGAGEPDPDAPYTVETWVVR
jgi:hypothetical protein